MSDWGVYLALTLLAVTHTHFIPPNHWLYEVFPYCVQFLELDRNQLVVFLSNFLLLHPTPETTEHYFYTVQIISACENALSETPTWQNLI